MRSSDLKRLSIIGPVQHGKVHVGGKNVRARGQRRKIETAVGGSCDVACLRHPGLVWPGIGGLGSEIYSGRRSAVGKISVSANVPIESRAPAHFGAATILQRYGPVWEWFIPLGSCRGHHVLTRRKPVGPEFAVRARGHRFRFGARDGDCDVRQSGGIVTTGRVGPQALNAAVDGSARWSLRQRLDPLNVGVVRPIDDLVSARAVTGAEVAIWRGTGVDQVIAPLFEFETTHGA